MRGKISKIISCTHPLWKVYNQKNKEAWITGFTIKTLTGIKPNMYSLSYNQDDFYWQHFIKLHQEKPLKLMTKLPLEKCDAIEN